VYYLLRDLVDPITVSFLLMGLALIFVWWTHPEARKNLRLVIFSYGLGWLACTPAVGYWAAGALEWRYPPLVEMPAEADAIVLLSGGAYSPSQFLPQTRPASDTLRRCQKAAQLYRTRPRPIIACGGRIDQDHTDETLAELMRQTLVDMGVPSEDIVLETTSTDTFENAEGATELMQERGYERAVLVTDATHLRRAIMCFRKHGFDVIPAAAHYAAASPRGHVSDFIPRTKGAQETNAVMHEAAGMLWYRIRGRI